MSTRAATPARAQYELRVAGHLAEHWSGWFDGLTLLRAYDGTTSALARYNGGGENGYSRGIWNVDWQDAGIGAGLALALVLLGGGAALASRHAGRAQTA